MTAILEDALQAPLETMGIAAKKHVTEFPWSLAAAKTIAAYQSIDANVRHIRTKRYLKEGENYSN